MEYNIQLPLSFQQLLHLVLQLPIAEQKRLTEAIAQNNTWMPNLPMKTIDEILAEDYQYPQRNPQRLIGAWDGNESIDTLLSLHKK